MHASPPLPREGEEGQRSFACISSGITTVIRVTCGAIKGTITDLMSHSQFHCTVRVHLDLHGLIFETSICYWQDQPGSAKHCGRFKTKGPTAPRPQPGRSDWGSGASAPFLFSGGAFSKRFGQQPGKVVISRTAVRPTVTHPCLGWVGLGSAGRPSFSGPLCACKRSPAVYDSLG